MESNRQPALPLDVMTQSSSSIPKNRPPETSDRSKKSPEKPKRNFKEVMRKKEEKSTGREKSIFEHAAEAASKPVTLDISVETSEEIRPMEINELIETMVDTLTHESTNGVSRTTVTLEMHGGIEIQIDHYDTHSIGGQPLIRSI